MAPAIQMARRDIVEPLKDSGRGVSGGFRRGRLRNALVVVELALSLVLLTGAGVMIRTFVATADRRTWGSIRGIFWWRGCRSPKGNTRRRGEAAVLHAIARASERAAGSGAIDDDERRCRRMAGSARISIFRARRTRTGGAGLYQLVSEDYLRTLGARLVRGRMLDAGDVAGGRKVAVVNQTLAGKWFVNEDPLGRQID